MSVKLIELSQGEGKEGEGTGDTDGGISCKNQVLTTPQKSWPHLYRLYRCR